MDRKRAESLKSRYLGLYERLIDAALNGEVQAFMPCEGVLLQLFLGEDGELHWRQISEDAAGNG